MPASVPKPDIDRPDSQVIDPLGPAIAILALPTCYVDARGNYRLVNEAFCAWIGHPAARLLSSNVADILGPEASARIAPHLAAVRAGQTASYDRCDQLADGSERWSRVVFSPHKLADGRIPGFIASVQDIQNLKALEREAVQREQRLRLITDNIGMPMGYVDRDFVFRFTNQPGLEGLGLNPHEMVGRHVAEIFGDAVFQEVRPHLEAALSGRKVSYERLARQGDARRWVRTTLIPDVQPDGAVVGLYTVVADIDQDYQLRRELQQKEARLRLITDNIGAPITYIDRELRFQFVNKPGERWAGRPAQNIVGHPIVDVLGSETATAIQPFLDRAFRGEAVTYERQADWTQDGPRWIRNHLFPDCADDGTVVGVYTLLTDISEDHRLREALAASEKRIRGFADNVPVAIGYLDLNRHYTFVNAAFETMRGLPKEQILGRHPDDMLGKASSDFNRPYRERAFAGEAVTFEKLITRPDGVSRWYRVRLAPDFGPDGMVRGIYAISMDMHEQKLAETALRESETELRVMMESVPYPLAYIDASLRYGQANSAYEYYTGHRPEDLVGKHLSEVFDHERYTTALPNLQRALSGETFEVERLIPKVNGDGDRWLLIRYTPRFNERGEVIGMYSAGVDIDDLKRAELELRHANSMLVSHFENTPLAVIEWRRDRQLLRWSPQAEKMFGWSYDEMRRQNWDEWKLVYEEDASQVRDIYARLFTGEQRRVTSLNRNYRKDGRVIWCEWYNSSLVDENGEVLSVLSLGQDVTSRVLAEERLQHLATHDSLTGLPNRVMLLDRLRQAITRARRAGSRVCAIFIDLDRFKEVNDTLGHRIGDELLREMSVRLSRVVRESDLLVRLSGDEFMVVLEQVTDLDAPQMVAQKLLDEIREPGHIEGHEIYVSASLGLSLFPDDGDDAEALMRNADLAMYRAKEQGKNNFQMFSLDMAAHGAEMRLLENALRSAISRQELELHYQPVYAMDDNRLVGVEALLRWHHPARGMLTPGSFIHLAEETGLVHDIGNWVLDAALAQLSAWQTAGHANIRMAINLSAGQFRAVHFAERIKEKVRRSGCPPASIELEVTETSLLQDPEGVGHMLEDLRALGLRVAIDDFGTGYSSLSHLKRFPIDTLKVDRSFVTDVVTDADNAAIVTAVIALGRALRLEIVAEGVEQTAQRDWLATHGCHAFQGYLASKPLPAREISLLLSSANSGI